MTNPIQSTTSRPSYGWAGILLILLIAGSSAIAQMYRPTPNDTLQSVTIGPVVPGAYRYNFIVDQVPVIDPRNPAVSESYMNAWSLLYVPGSEYMDRVFSN